MLYVIEAFLFITVLLIVFTQVIIPSFRGTVWFPFFRKEKILQEQIQELRQVKIEKELEKEITLLEDKKVEEKKERTIVQSS